MGFGGDVLKEYLFYIMSIEVVEEVVDISFVVLG